MTHEPQQPLNGRPPQEQESFCPYCMSRVAPGQSCPVCGLTQGAYTPAPHHLPLGTILAGRYLVGRALGEGGFGITYIGCDLRLEMKVAIKEYFPVDRVSRFSETSLSVISRVGTESQDYDQGLKRFLYEARTMARMEKQPQIVMVRDYFEANHTAYIVMEYVEGTNFMQLTAQRGGRIAAGELLPLIEPLFSALSAVHAAGLIHRDISPDNLMLERGSVRLLDFGCARESARGTETMTIALKQGYAPIEQYQRKGQGPWTDVYALSATIYYCLTSLWTASWRMSSSRPGIWEWSCRRSSRTLCSAAWKSSPAAGTRPWRSFTPDCTARPKAFPRARRLSRLRKRLRPSPPRRRSAPGNPPPSRTGIRPLRPVPSPNPALLPRPRRPLPPHLPPPALLRKLLFRTGRLRRPSPAGSSGSGNTKGCAPLCAAVPRPSSFF